MSYPKHRSKGRGASGRGQGFRGGHGRPGHNSSPLPLLDDANFNVYNNPAMTYGIIQCVGLHVDLRTKNNKIYKGILRNMSPTMEITLELAHMSSDSNGQVIAQTPTRSNVIGAVVFPWKDVADIKAMGCDEDSIKKDSFTDSAISKFNGQVKEKKLQKWQGQEVIPAAEEWSSNSNPTENGVSSWDMFEDNKRKFGVESCFDDKMLSYTTPLEKEGNPDYAKQEQQATRIAREIEESNAYGAHNEVDSGKTDEELYASVVRNSSSAGDQRSATPPVNSNKKVEEPVPIKPKVENTVAAAPKPVVEIARTVDPVASSTPPVTVPDALSEPVDSAPKPVATENKAKPDTATKPAVDVAKTVSPVISVASVDTAPISSSKLEMPDVKELKVFSENFKLNTAPGGKPKSKTPREETAAEQEADTTQPASDTEPYGNEEKPEPGASADLSILEKSTLNPKAVVFCPASKEPKPRQDPTPPPSSTPTYMVPAHYATKGPPYPVTTVVHMPQPMYTRKGPFTKPHVQQRYYGGPEPSDSPQSVLSAAQATGSPIITGPTGPMTGHVHQGQYIPMQQQQAMAYVSPHGVIPPQMQFNQGQMPPVQVVFGSRFPGPVSAASPPYAPDGVYGGVPSQPQASPSQHGQFVFQAVSPMVPQQGGPPPQASMGPPHQVPPSQGPFQGVFMNRQISNPQFVGRGVPTQGPRKYAPQYQQN